jgi:hypothetical protein
MEFIMTIEKSSISLEEMINEAVGEKKPEAVNPADTDAGKITNCETMTHIRVVQSEIDKVLIELVKRSRDHDKSKLESPELEYFIEFTPKLKGSTYGSEEYNSFREQMKPALDHHYANNSHHIEHYPNGINGMNLIDLIEMVCDWNAAVKRHDDGNIEKSITINKERFGYSDEISTILLNTLKYLNSLS